MGAASCVGASHVERCWFRVRQTWLRDRTCRPWEHRQPGQHAHLGRADAVMCQRRSESGVADDVQVTVARNHVPWAMANPAVENDGYALPTDAARMGRLACPRLHTACAGSCASGPVDPAAVEVDAPEVAL